MPALLGDGRVIYSRWGYTDKPLWRLQKLSTTNQDGTGTAHFWGNQSVWPDHLSEPRPIPGSRRVMFSGVGHHDWWSGSIGIVDPDLGRDYERFVQPVLDRHCVKCHRGEAKDSEEPNLTLRPGHSVFKEPYLTLVGSAGWGNPVRGGRPGYGIAGAIPVESSYGQDDPKGLTTLRPMQYLSYKSRLIELAASGKHRIGPPSTRRPIAGDRVFVPSQPGFVVEMDPEDIGPRPVDEGAMGNSLAAYPTFGICRPGVTAGNG